MSLAELRKRVRERAGPSSAVPSEAFARAWDDAYADLAECVRRDDEAMGRALRGEPFWGVGKPEGVEVVGLADFLPVKDPP